MKPGARSLAPDFFAKVRTSRRSRRHRIRTKALLIRSVILTAGSPANSTLSVTYHLTHECNLRCAYCYTGEKFRAAMGPEVADAGVALAVAEAKRQGADHLETVFFGGEPLLRHALLCHIVDRTREAADDDMRLSFKLSTNGTLLSAKIMRELTDREIFLSLSVDGSPQLQDEQRPDAAGRGSSIRVDEAIGRVLAHNPCANVTCVITPTSAGRADESVQWLFERGFSFVTTTLDYGGDWDAGSLEELEAAYRRLADWYVEKTVAGETFYLSAFDERIRSHATGPAAADERCQLGIRQFSIAPSGRLYPCVQFVHEDDDHRFAIGDLERGFDESNRQGLGRQSETSKPECGGCAIQPRCSSWCACVNFQSTGRIDRASPVVCEHERILMPIADETAQRLWRRRDSKFIHKHYNPAWTVFSFFEKMVIEEEADHDPITTP